MKQLGFFVGIGYRFVCDCGKDLNLRPQSSDSQEPIQISHLYKQCECCYRTYKISFDNGLNLKEEESQKIASLFLQVSKLNLEASRLSGLAMVDQMI